MSNLGAFFIPPSDTHANRPSASAVGIGALFSCQTHNKVYRSDGTNWIDWLVFAAPGSSGGTGVPIMLPQDDPEEPMLIPGPQGLVGPTGPAGPAGSGSGGGVVILGMQGEDGEDPLIIPGPTGPAGSPSGSGAVVQIKNFQTGAMASGSTLTPFDDTIPQNTEGDEYMSLTITPTNAANKLLIEVVGYWGSGLSSASLTVALFQDSTTDALAATCDLIMNNAAAQPISLVHFMTAGTTSATTFKVRAGVNAGSVVLNGIAGPARRLGGVAASSITITEIVP